MVDSPSRAFSQLLVAAFFSPPFLVLSWTSLSTTSRHGKASLQWSLTASLATAVPQMLPNTTLLT